LINLTELLQFFPNVNKPIIYDDYSFMISINQDITQDIFVINLKIKQKDKKENHLIKFRLGLGKDKLSDSKSHKTNEPHFEIDIYKREEKSFSANLYFTFDNVPNKILLNYAKGTIVIISKIIKNFIQTHSIDPNFIDKLVYFKVIHNELNEYEQILINALYECYKTSNLIVREKGEVFTIKTPNNLAKYLNFNDLNPLYLPLSEKVKNQK
jgi:hypothetical protein